MDEHEYRDIDGNLCTLDSLCRREPEWAASRHRVMLARIAELEADAAHHDRIVSEELSSALEGEMATVARLRKILVDVDEIYSHWKNGDHSATCGPMEELATPMGRFHKCLDEEDDEEE